jgi:hypothetical protein
MEIKCPCGCGSEIKESKPDDDLSLESFDCKLRIISMPIEQLEKLEEAGRVKDLAEYEG